MTLYLSGPITGTKDYRERFAAAARKLEADGYEVLNPVDFDFPDDIDWKQAMRAAVRLMLCADGVALMPNWEKSRGAQAEATIADMLEIAIKTVQEWIYGLKPLKNGGLSAAEGAKAKTA